MTANLRLMLAAVHGDLGAPENNLANHRIALEQASRAGCQLAVFPEMSLTGSIDPQREPDLLVGIDSEPVVHMVRSTQEYSVGAVFGIAEATLGGDAFITQIYACQGRLMGVYRKRRLAEDQSGFSPGGEGAVFTFGSLRFGISIGAESEVDPPFSGALADGANLIFRCGTGAAVLVPPDGNVVEHLSGRADGALVVDVPVDFEVEPPRRAARVLVMDDAGRSLLVRFTDNAGFEWLATPGGGLEPGEDHRQAARRELHEELGRDDIEIGPGIGWRNHTLAFNGGPWVTQREHWFLARCAPFKVAAETLASLEAEYVTDVRWWSIDELARSGKVTAPRNLLDLINRIVSGELPSADTDLGL